MDALEFLRERKRMCKSFGTSCDGCPLNGSRCTDINSMNDGDLERILVKVEQWSKGHPRKTRQSVFLKLYPETILDDFGVISLCPMKVSATYRDSDGNCNSQEILCIDCRRKFWMQGVEGAENG